VHAPDGTAGSGRHSLDFYDQTAEDRMLGAGERFFVLCVGGPSESRLETFPPPLEMNERGGTYVLEDDGPRVEWRYRFVPNSP
jgi:hypothetical protein